MQNRNLLRTLQWTTPPLVLIVLFSAVNRLVDGEVTTSDYFWSALGLVMGPFLTYAWFRNRRDLRAADAQRSAEFAPGHSDNGS